MLRFRLPFTSTAAALRPGRRRSIRLRAVLVSLLLAVLLLLAFGLHLRPQSDSPPLDLFRAALERHDYPAARRIYFSDLHGDAGLRTESERLTLAALRRIERAYAAASLPAEDARSCVRALEDSGIFIPSQALEEIRNSLKRHASSRRAWHYANAAAGLDLHLEALAAYAEVLPGDVPESRLAERTEQVRLAYRREILAASEELVADNPLGAIDLVAAAHKELPGDRELAERLSELLAVSDLSYRTAILAEVEQLEQAGRLESAIGRLEAAIFYLERLVREGTAVEGQHPLAQTNINADLRTLHFSRQRLLDQYSEQILAESDRLQATDQTEAALALLLEPLVRYPDAELLRSTARALLASYRENLTLTAPSDITTPGGALILWPPPSGIGSGDLVLTELPLPASTLELEIQVGPDGALPAQPVRLRARSGENVRSSQPLVPGFTAALSLPLAAGEPLSLSLLAGYDGEEKSLAADTALDITVTGEFRADPDLNWPERYGRSLAREAAHERILSAGLWRDLTQLRAADANARPLPAISAPAVPLELPPAPGRWLMTAGDEAAWTSETELVALRGSLRPVAPTGPDARNAAVRRLAGGHGLVAGLCLNEQLVWRGNLMEGETSEFSFVFPYPGRRLAVCCVEVDASGAPVKPYAASAWQVEFALEVLP